MSKQAAYRLTGSDTKALFDAMRAFSTAEEAYDRDAFGAARRLAHNALAQFPAAWPSGAGSTDRDLALSHLSDLEGRAEYDIGDFAAAAQAERTALQAAKLIAGNDIRDQRAVAGVATWLSMALAREGKRAEAAQTIGPVVTMYRALEKKNRSDQWLPLELAEALYAQSLSDPQHRAALLREATQRVDHLIPAIAKLHDTRQWRARIEAAERASVGEAD